MKLAGDSLSSPSVQAQNKSECAKTLLKAAFIQNLDWEQHQVPTPSRYNPSKASQRLH